MRGRHLPEALLNDYVEGLLSPAAREEAEAHLASCHACRAEADSLRALLAGMRALPRGIRPRRDLLPSIRREIREPAVHPIAEPRRRTARPELRVPLAAAAILALVVITGVSAWLVGERRGALVADRGPAATPSPARGVAPAALSQVTADYERAIGELAADLEARRPELEPATVRLVEENLRVIDQAILESREALAADPGSEILPDLVVSGYERKLDLLRRATEIAEL